MKGIALWAKIKAALALDDKIPGLAIHISVDDDGSVTLYGDVDKVAVWEHVGEVVAKVDGVNQLTNYLTVGRTAKPAERAIFSPEAEDRLSKLQGEIRQALSVDGLNTDGANEQDAIVTAWVTPTAIAVLEGQVSTLKEKADAEATVRKIPGVEGVINRLDCSEERGFPSSPPSLADAIGLLREAWAHSEARRLFDIAGLLAAGVTPRREDDRLILDGDVDNFATKDQAEDLARYVFDGEVENRLTVGEGLTDLRKPDSDRLSALHNPEEAAGEPRYRVEDGLPLGSNVAGQAELEQLRLQKTLQQKIAQDPTLQSETEVAVSVSSHGVVHLSGVLTSERMRRRIEGTVWRTRGVSDVKNGLRVAAMGRR